MTLKTHVMLIPLTSENIGASMTMLNMALYVIEIVESQHEFHITKLER